MHKLNIIIIFRLKSDITNSITYLMKVKEMSQTLKLDPKNESEELVYHEYLQNFLSQLCLDLLADKPDDILQYMATKMTKNTSGSPQNTEKPTMSEDDHTKLVDDIRREICILTKLYTHIKNQADGYKYKYLQSLEESDYDMEYTQRIQSQMHTVRKRACSIREKLLNLENQLHTLQSRPTMDIIKLKALKTICETYKHDWTV